MGYPLNYHFVFGLTVLINIGSVVASIPLPASISQQKKEDNEGDESTTQNENANSSEANNQQLGTDNDRGIERTEDETNESVV